MKFKLFLLAFSIGLISFDSYSQNLKKDVKITKGEVTSFNRSRGIPQYISGSGENYFTYSYVKNDIISISEFDKNLQEIKKSEIDLDFNDIKNELEEIFYLNEQLYLVSSHQDKKSKRIILELRSLNKNLQLNNDVKKITEIDYSENSKAKRANFRIQFSSNRKYILVSEWVGKRNGIFSKSNQISNLPVTIINSENMSINWSNVLTFDATEDPEDLMQVIVSNEGKAILLIKKYDDKRKDRAKGAPNYDYYLRQFESSNKPEKTYSIQLKSNYITDVNIVENSDQNIICTGFYTKDEKGRGIQGSYYLLIDKESKSVIKESLKEFDHEFLIEFLGKKDAKKANKKKDKGETMSLSNFHITDVIVRDDGGVIQVAENKYSITTTTTSSNGAQSSVTKYYNNTIFIISISPEGEIEWSRKIPKKQVGVESWRIYSSYGLGIVNNKVYIFFNDNPKNLMAKDYKDLKYAYMNKKSVLRIYEIETEGFTKKDIILEEKLEKINFLPSYMFKTENDNFILYGNKGNKIKTFRLEIK